MTMTFLPYLTAAGFVTLAMLFVWVAVVWLPGFVRRERIDPLEDPESVDDPAATGRFTRLDVDDD